MNTNRIYLARNQSQLDKILSVERDGMIAVAFSDGETPVIADAGCPSNLEKICFFNSKAV